MSNLAAGQYYGDVVHDREPWLSIRLAFCHSDEIGAAGGRSFCVQVSAR
jgi:hypothetical protein